MKWVKVAIGAVIAIAVVPMIATTVYNLTQEQVQEYQIDITVYTDNSVDITSQDQSFIIEYYEFFVSYTLSPETVNGTFYGESTTIDDIDISEGSYGPPGHAALRVSMINMSSLGGINLSENGVIVDEPVFSGSFTPDTDYTVSLLFEVTRLPQLTGINATLLLLAPLVFAGGVLAYLLNKQNY